MARCRRPGYRSLGGKSALMYVGRGLGPRRLPIFPGGVRLPGGPLIKKRPTVVVGRSPREASYLLKGYHNARRKSTSGLYRPRIAHVEAGGGVVWGFRTNALDLGTLRRGAKSLKNPPGNRPLFPAGLPSLDRRWLPPGR